VARSTAITRDPSAHARTPGKFLRSRRIVEAKASGRPSTPPTLPCFIGPRRGRLDGYRGNPFTRAFPRGAAWALAPGAWPDWPQFPRSSRGGQPDHLLIFPCLLPLPVPRESASPPAPSVPGGRPRQQAAAGYSSPTQSETRPSGSFRPGW